MKQEKKNVPNLIQLSHKSLFLIERSSAFSRVVDEDHGQESNSNYVQYRKKCDFVTSQTNVFIML